MDRYERAVWGGVVLTPPERFTSLEQLVAALAVVCSDEHDRARRLFGEGYERRLRILTAPSASDGVADGPGDERDDRA
ncbi:hypothetical protein ACFWWM_09620 [Streptomyces sp. NPDC058682]|uniref:hypothetical protein n=1 Tax=Streptomyces sp. NPDC058682 TaxID=3346596 RepID=UPI003655A1C3